jgi:hypothetical protein
MNALPLKIRFAAIGIVFMAGSLLPSARAQDADDLQRGVARISVMEGEVSVRRGDSGEWVAGIVNAPLMGDDWIATGPNSRVEVQLDAANVLRLGANAELHLTQLEAARFQMEMARGTMTYNVIRPAGGEAEVDTPILSIRPAKQGIYRIQVADSGETQVIARAGEIEVFTPRGSQWVGTGQMMMARGSQSDPEFQIVNGPALDEWDRWNDSRDRGITQSTSYQYVGPGVYGVEDLDANGTWQNVAPYGYSWSPNGVGADWAPYGNGRWTWEDWYGWTWIGSEPWGWAPYHYGRWFWGNNRWWWYPGSIGARHYWSPALVAFFGFGSGRTGGFGFGNVGWVPLAPYEVLHPWWGRGYYGRTDYFNRGINFTNVNVGNIYRNARVGRGISGLAAEDFRTGRFGRVGRFSGDQVRQAGLARGALPLAPTRDSLRFSNRGVSNIPRTTGNRQFYMQRQPNPVQRVPFSQVGEGVRNAGGGSFNRPNGGGSAIAGRDAMRPENRTAQGISTGGWRRFGESAGGQNATPQPRQMDRGNSFRGSPNNGGGQAAGRFENMRPPQASPDRSVQSRGGWQRFGESGNGQSRSGFNAAPPQRAPESQRGAPGPNGPSQRYSAPGNSGAPAYGFQPQQRSPESQRGAPGYNGPSQRYSAPGNSAAPGYGFRQRGQNYSAPPAPRNMPQYQAPRQQAPRGGGGYNAPAPRNFNGGSNAPRSFGGGGSAPRGGGGGSAPRMSGGGGGGHSSGGGGGHSSGGHSGGGGGHGRR